MNYTHICIKTPIRVPEGTTPLLKKGDYCTLVEEKLTTKMSGRKVYVFKEHPGVAYSAYLFSPLSEKERVPIEVDIAVYNLVKNICLN